MVEKRIRDLQEQTTTMLMHAEAEWPDVITANLWLYALREASESLNLTPSKVTGKIANELFSRSDTQTVLQHFHPFGCPTYVLNDSLAAGKSIPKWNKIALLGVYLGRSPSHAQSIALVLNLAQGFVSPQFHLKFDDLFETVKGHDTYPNRWKSATHFRKKPKSEISEGRPPSGVNAAKDATPEQRIEESNQPDTPDMVANPSADDCTAVVRSDGVAIVLSPSCHCNEPLTQQEDDATTRRWSRRHKPTRRLTESQPRAAANASGSVRAYLATELAIENDYDTNVYHGEEGYEIQRKMADPIAFAASADPNTMYLHEAVRQLDKKEFAQVMVDEVTTHTERGHWKIIPIEEVPEGTKILPAVWVMRLKRRILSCKVYKWKARLNVHGGKQTHGVDYRETYAASLKWSSIRFFYPSTD